MKKTLVILLALGLVLFGVIGFIVSNYNSLVKVDEEVKTAWSNVEDKYQRRLDLVPNLVRTVKGYAKHEAETLENVINARAKATQTNVNVNNPNDLKTFTENQTAISSALSRLLVTVEQYPELKANENFLDLQKQLEGTENRISVARKDYNETVKKYNTSRRKFPKILVANMFSFKEASLFSAEKGAEKAPEVEF